MKKKKGFNLFSVVILIISFLIAYSFFNSSGSTIDKITYTEFIKQEDNIKEISASVDAATGNYRIDGVYSEKVKKAKEFTLTAPNSISTDKYLNELSEDGVEVNYTKPSRLLGMLASLIYPVLMIGFILFFIMRQSSGNGAFEFGKSKARLNDNGKTVTYNDVAGLEEEKQELIEVVDFLKAPKRFTDMGARIPKGVLLVGPPGTGKTLLARSVAGEAGVPFYFISGSDFLEMFVGVGASRVRDMFKKAKASAPCIIFIDEIDAIGRQRGAGLGGGNDEREQTLNQILVEMDGFEGNEGVIILAATNRADVLDPALLRPGRFDRQVIVNLPTVAERARILELHAKNKFFESDVDLTAVASRTPGFSGADLENVLNEAALLAVRLGSKTIAMDTIDEAVDRVLMGPAKSSKKYTEHEKQLVAHHEAGHVVCGLVLDNASEVHKVTIIPRGMAGGYAMMLPKEERFFNTKTELIERIVGLLAGRVSEEIVFKEISTGAHNDFEQATKIARAMVTEFGMSDLGPVQWEQRDGNVFLGRDYMNNKNFSDSIASEIDKEIRKIIHTAYDETTRILTENLEMLKEIANTLIEKESLNKEEIIVIYNRFYDENEQKRAVPLSLVETVETNTIELEEKDE